MTGFKTCLYFETHPLPNNAQGRLNKTLAFLFILFSAIKTILLHFFLQSLSETFSIHINLLFSLGM